MSRVIGRARKRGVTGTAHGNSRTIAGTATSVVAVEISQLSDDVLADPLARHIQGVLFVQVLL
jgi:hypothetical protein